MIFNLYSQIIYIVSEHHIPERRPSLSKASASEHMRSPLCSPTLGMAWILCGFLVWVLCVRLPSCSWLRDAPVCGSPGQGCTVEYESSRAFASFLRSWHSRHVLVRCCCCCVTGISDAEAPYHTRACTYTDPDGVCDASLGWPEVLVHWDHVPAL